MNKHLAARPARRQLPLAQRPARDQALWLSVLAPGDALEEGGRGAGWAPKTVEQRRRAYAYWLRFLETTGALDATTAPGDRVTPERVRAYVVALLGTAPPAPSKVAALHERWTSRRPRMRPWR